MADKKTKDKKVTLNPKHELFCQVYVSEDFFGNGVRSYAHAYNIDLSKKGGYSTCKVNASKLLTNTNILDRINEIMEHAILNDEFVDRELGWLIQQKDDKGAKVAAIREYNKVKKRVEDGLKIDVAEGSTINIIAPKDMAGDE